MIMSFFFIGNTALHRTLSFRKDGMAETTIVMLRPIPYYMFPEKIFCHTLKLGDYFQHVYNWLLKNILFMYLI